MNTGNAKISGAQSENGPRSLYDSVGSRKTPLPTTALMHIATRPQKPTARTNFSLELFCMKGRRGIVPQGGSCRGVNGGHVFPGVSHFAASGVQGVTKGSDPFFQAPLDD